MFRIGMATAIAVLVVSAPALAQCLDGSALSRGVTVQYDNGDFTVMRRTVGGYQQIDEHYASGDPMFRFRAHRGIYFVEEFEPDASGRPVPGTGLRIEFEVDPASLPEPAAGVRWQGQTMNVFDDGEVRPEIMTVTYTAGPDLTVPGCSYAALGTELRYDWGDEGALTLRYAYLTEIGTAILLSSQFDGDSAFSYTPVSLGLAQK